MTRQEAIKAIVSVWAQRDSEFCCSDGERKESETELQDCLLALGVSVEDMEGICH